MVRGVALWLLGAASCAPLAGCVVMTPSPVVEALQMAVVTATGAGSLAPTSAQNVVVHEHPAPRNVCIEINPNSPVPDLVPSIQAELQARGVTSRVYEPGGAPADCESVLTYSASMAWDKPMFSSTHASYLSGADLVLRSQGRVLASASYHLRAWGLDKWSSTRSKIGPIVAALMTTKVR